MKKHLLNICKNSKIYKHNYTKDNMIKKQMQKIIAQGAEANIIHTGKFIIKHRIKKSYRHPELDRKLIKSRTKSEAKLLTKASEIIPSPKPFFIPNTDFTKIKMPFIQGKKLSEHLDNFKTNQAKKICEQIGQNIAKIHQNDLIHGDLTTSNMIFSEKDSLVYFIDFGLGFHSSRIEDKAVDLHLLRQALEAKHFKNWEILFKSVIKGYKSQNKEAEKVLQQLKKVESRGRYKTKG